MGKQESERRFHREVKCDIWGHLVCWRQPRLRLLIHLDAGGLVINPLRQRGPAIFQGGERVPGGYVLHGRQMAFEIGAYGRERPLMIDPVLSFNARFGARGQSILATGNGRHTTSG